MNRIFAVAFWCAAAFAFAMAVLPNPPHVPLESNDKVQHMLAFATLAALGTLGYPRLPTLRLAVGLCAFGGLIEIVQMVPLLHRDAEVGDWLADTLAIGVSLFIVCTFLRFRAKSSD